ncbi:MAG: hypothetical protein WC933_02725 [Candidatus Paceibacterota bacterium]|jgi:hypothetical protein
MLKEHKERLDKQYHEMWDKKWDKTDKIIFFSLVVPGMIYVAIHLLIFILR